MRFDASLEWLGERIAMCEEEMEMIRADTKMEECEKSDIAESMEDEMYRRRS